MLAAYLSQQLLSETEGVEGCPLAGSLSGSQREGNNLIYVLIVSAM